jgi:hypothetical protein
MFSHCQGRLRGLQETARSSSNENRGVLYDPSYGVTYAYNPATQATKLAGFVAALGGLMTIVPFNNVSYNFNLNGAGINNNNSYWIALFKPITAAMLQMTP